MSDTRALGEALDAASRAASLLVATDFDGVLAPLMLDPRRSAPLPGTIESLRAMATLPDVHVAVVSGRDLRTLRSLTGIGTSEPIVLIGSHGAESSSAAVRPAMAAGPSAEDEIRLAALREDLSAVIGGHHPEAGLEFKAAAVTVLTRGLATDVADRANHAAREVARRHDGVRVLTGKSILELTISEADKGSAIAALGDDRRATARIYLGDDVTDEDAFARMTGPTDVTIKVGAGPTAARYRLDDETAVAETFRALRDLLASRRPERSPTREHTG
ncbi:MAG: trehalose-phosphatase [Micrococcales bacterium]|nr:trehalose-phosphatase [Micrococcales bacterium]